LDTKESIKMILGTVQCTLLIFLDIEADAN